MCEVDAVPVTKDLQWFRYGRTEHEEEKGEHLRLIYRDQRVPARLLGHRHSGNERDEGRVS